MINLHTRCHYVATDLLQLDLRIVAGASVVGALIQFQTPQPIFPQQLQRLKNLVQML